MSQWLLSSLRVKSKVLVARDAAESLHTLPHILPPSTPSYWSRWLSIISCPVVTTLSSPSCCDCFSCGVCTPPRAVSCELRYRNLMDDRALLPEASIWGRKWHFILNWPIMLNWNFPWRHQALMIWNSIVKCLVHMQMGQGKWLRINFLTLNIFTHKEDIKSPEESKLKERGFSEEHFFEGKREFGYASTLCKRKEGAHPFPESLLGGVSHGGHQRHPQNRARDLNKQDSFNLIIKAA